MATLSKAKHGGEISVRLDPVRKKMQSRKVHPELIPPSKVGFEPWDYGLERIARKGLKRLSWEFDRIQPIAFSVCPRLA